MEISLKKTKKSIPAEQSKDGKAHNFVNFFVEFNGQRIPVKPCFKEDVGKLSIIADEVA